MRAIDTSFNRSCSPGDQCSAGGFSGLAEEYPRRITLSTSQDRRRKGRAPVAGYRSRVPPELVPYLFTPSLHTTKPAGEGTGLGLSLLYGLVKAHGGCSSMKRHRRAGPSPCHPPAVPFELSARSNGSRREQWPHGRAANPLVDEDPTPCIGY